MEKIEKESPEVRKQKHQNRKMVEDLPVQEPEIIESSGVDLSLYRRQNRRRGYEGGPPQTWNTLREGNHGKHSGRMAQEDGGTAPSPV